MSAPTPAEACTPAWADRIDACLGGDAGPEDWSALRGHLADCGACARAYDEAGRLDALLAGGLDTDLPPAAVAEGERRMLAALVAQRTGDGARATPVAPPPTARVLLFRRPAVWGALALAAAAAALAVLSTPEPPVGAPDSATDFTARGAENPNNAVGFRAFCIDVTPPSPAVRSSALADGPAARCVRGDRLQFTYSAQAPTHLALWQVGPDGVARRLWGDALTGGVVDAVIRQTWPLETAGELTVYGVFGDVPAPAALTAASLAQAAGRPLPGVGRVHAVRLVVEAQ